MRVNEEAPEWPSALGLETILHNVVQSDLMPRYPCPSFSDFGRDSLNIILSKVYIEDTIAQLNVQVAWKKCLRIAVPVKQIQMFQVQHTVPKSATGLALLISKRSCSDDKSYNRIVPQLEDILNAKANMKLLRTLA